MNKIEHLITCLGEEGCEISQDCSKANRFGLGEVYKKIGISNTQRIINELNDLLAVVDLLVDEGIFPPNWESDEQKDRKKIKVKEYMEYAKKQGTLKNE